MNTVQTDHTDCSVGEVYSHAEGDCVSNTSMEGKAALSIGVSSTNDQNLKRYIRREIRAKRHNNRRPMQKPAKQTSPKRETVNNRPKKMNTVQTGRNDCSVGEVYSHAEGNCVPNTSIEEKAAIGASSTKDQNLKRSIRRESQAKHQKTRRPVQKPAKQTSPRKETVPHETERYWQNKKREEVAAKQKAVQSVKRHLEAHNDGKKARAQTQDRKTLETAFAHIQQMARHLQAFALNQTGDEASASELAEFQREARSAGELLNRSDKWWHAVQEGHDRASGLHTRLLRAQEDLQIHQNTTVERELETQQATVQRVLNLIATIRPENRPTQGDRDRFTQLSSHVHNMAECLHDAALKTKVLEEWGGDGPRPSGDVSIDDARFESAKTAAERLLANSPSRATKPGHDLARSLHGRLARARKDLQKAADGARNFKPLLVKGKKQGAAGFAEQLDAAVSQGLNGSTGSENGCEAHHQRVAALVATPQTGPNVRLAAVWRAGAGKTSAAVRFLDSFYRDARPKLVAVADQREKHRFLQALASTRYNSQAAAGAAPNFEQALSELDPPLSVFTHSSLASTSELDGRVTVLFDAHLLVHGRPDVADRLKSATGSAQLYLTAAPAQDEAQARRFMDVVKGKGGGGDGDRGYVLYMNGSPRALFADTEPRRLLDEMRVLLTEVGPDALEKYHNEAAAEEGDLDRLQALCNIPDRDYLALESAQSIIRSSKDDSAAGAASKLRALSPKFVAVAESIASHQRNTLVLLDDDKGARTFGAILSHFARKGDQIVRLSDSFTRGSGRVVLIAPEDGDLRGAEADWEDVFIMNPPATWARQKEHYARAQRMCAKRPRNGRPLVITTVAASFSGTERRGGERTADEVRLDTVVRERDRLEPLLHTCFASVAIAVDTNSEPHKAPRAHMDVQYIPVGNFSRAGKTGVQPQIQRSDSGDTATDGQDIFLPETDDPHVPGEPRWLPL